MNKSLRVSWMWRHSGYPMGDEMIDIMDELDSVGYYSVLLTVHSRMPDFLPKVAYSLNRDQKIKYMVAIRPYLLSPQYFKMLIRGFDDIQPNRIMINWVHGELGPKENFDGVLDLQDDLSQSTQRRGYLKRFIDALDNVDMFHEFTVPESLISGGSPEAVALADSLNMHSANGYDSFVGGGYAHYTDKKFEKVFIQVDLMIRDTDEEAEDAYQRLVPDTHKGINVIFGSPETIIKKLSELADLGATDLLISNSFPCEREERDIVHKFAKQMLESGFFVGQD